MDVKHILETSDRFNGFNHLYLVACYINKDDSLFYVSFESAEKQLQLALNEKCDIAYYYQYLFYRDSDPIKAREGLYIICEYDYGPALLALGKEYEKGTLFKKDDNEAIKYYKRAADTGEVEAFIDGILLSKKKNDKQSEEMFYHLAEVKNIHLPGRVS